MSVATNERVCRGTVRRFREGCCISWNRLQDTSGVGEKGNNPWIPIRSRSAENLALSHFRAGLLDESHDTIGEPSTSSLKEEDMKKVGYGSGFLSVVKRVTGDVLAYRWYDTGRARKRVLGPIRKFKSEAQAWKEVERLGLGRKGSPETVEQLAQHWEEKETS